MKTRKARMVINYIMLISLIVAFVTGILLKPMPGMRMGIAHGVSGAVLMISAVIHCCVQNHMIQKK